MVRAWYHDNIDADQRAPHMTDPPVFMDIDELRQKSGILYWQVNVDNDKEIGLVEKIRTERNYDYEDTVDIRKESFPDYDAKLKMFYSEHLHKDEEVRLFLDGSGYLDVRGNDDRWIRIECVKGDLLVLPVGIYHRFTLDKKDYAAVRRLFQGKPVWTSYDRGEETDQMECRKKYVEGMKS